MLNINKFQFTLASHILMRIINCMYNGIIEKNNWICKLK